MSSKLIFHTNVATPLDTNVHRSQSALGLTFYQWRNRRWDWERSGRRPVKRDAAAALQRVNPQWTDRTPSGNVGCCSSPSRLMALSKFCSPLTLLVLKTCSKHSPMQASAPPPNSNFPDMYMSRVRQSSRVQPALIT